jgi:hypothetical protein
MTTPRREPHPFKAPFSERVPGRERFLDEPPPQPVPSVEDGATDSVLCGLSGRRIRRSDAVHIRIGPNRTMWIARDLTSKPSR